MTDQEQDQIKSDENQKAIEIFKRKALIVRNLQEVLQDEKLTKQLETGKNIHLYWGTATTGRPHVGYFVPMQKIADFLHAGIRVTILFADLHAFLDNLKSTFALLEKRVKYYELVIKALLLSLNVPIDRLHFVKGTTYQLSENYTIDLLKLCGLVSLRDALRAGAEVVKQVESPFLSGLLYPLLQALDEQYLKVDGQFGGVDQRKIFILAEEQLPKLKLGKRFHLMNPMVPGLTGTKMSSSEENTKIDLLDSVEVVNKKINSAICSRGNTEENGILAFYKHVVLPILLSSADEVEPAEGTIGRCIKLDGKSFADYKEIESAFEDGVLPESELKSFLKEFLNRILQKVQKLCNEDSNFDSLVAEAYPSKIEATITDELLSADLSQKAYMDEAGGEIFLSPSEKVNAQLETFIANFVASKQRPPRILWWCSTKGRVTLAHIMALLQLKRLKTTHNCPCSILISDLTAFLDRTKCPWAQFKSRTDYYRETIAAAMSIIGLNDVPIYLSSEYQFTSNHSLEMYKATSVLTRDETALFGEGANTLACNLAPVYFCLDVWHADADAILTGPNQKPFLDLYRKLAISLRWPNRVTTLIMPEITGMDGSRMSATKPDYHLDPHDGTKKVRQKIAKSFCEPGNLKGNVALSLSQNVIFPLLQNNSTNEDASFLIERVPEYGGDLVVKNYAELEALYLEEKLFPADLKTAVASQINTLFEAIRSTIPPPPAKSKGK